MRTCDPLVPNQMRYQAAPLPEPQEPLAFRPQNATLNPPAARIHRTGRTVGGTQFGHARVINLTRVAAKCATRRGRPTMAELLSAMGFRRRLKEDRGGKDGVRTSKYRK